MRNEIEIALARWEPTEANKICCCAGDTVCVYHELTDIIKKLAATMPLVEVAREGWQLVPKEPPEEMVSAGYKAYGAADIVASDDWLKTLYCAMLSAAPASPPRTEEEQ